MSRLHIPDVSPQDDTLGAALAYAAAGWFVLPIDPRSKHAGSVLGKGWPAKSSRDPQVITAWFAGTSYSLALHVGRSGGVALDVDDPKALPEIMVRMVTDLTVPHQSTRLDEPGRGHYVYLQPPGRNLGNGKGKLTGGWGEVRGANGIIVVSPSPHSKADQGGRYAWPRTGPVPELPAELAEALPDGAHADDAACTAQVRAFLADHTGTERTELLEAVLARFAEKVAAGESRHESAVSVTVWAMREAAAGYYSAQVAADRIRSAFTEAIGADRNARVEFSGILAWAVAQAKAVDVDELRARTEGRPGGAEDLSAPGANNGTGKPRATAFGEPLTELGIARRLIAEHGHELRYLPLWRKWLVWDGCRWARDTTGEAHRRAKATVRRLLLSADEIGDEDLAKKIRAAARKAETAYGIGGVLQLAGTELGIALAPRTSTPTRGCLTSPTGSWI
jgi:hypothetical protein